MLMSSFISRDGFTLVEMMVTLFLAFLLCATLYATYTMQRKAHATQGQVVEMQQNLRSAFEAMTREIRLAGYDPRGTAFRGGAVAISAARPTLFAFAADLDGNGVLGSVASPAGESEYLAFDLYTSGGAPTLGRASSATAPITINNPGPGQWQASGHQPVVDHIERLEFAYVLDDGRVVADASASGDEDAVRAVRVSILARARFADGNFRSSETFRTALGTFWTGIPGDGYRRRLAITEIDLRNLRR